MNREDIEDFLRRSNSISDKTPSPDDNVAVRRMSLKEFTGLDPSNKETIADLSLTGWKSSTCSSSLINSFSARRRSVLSQDIIDSPSKRLSAPKEESFDLPTAIDRVSALRHRLGECSHEKNSSKVTSSEDVKASRLLEESRRMAVESRELASLPVDTADIKWTALVAELTDCADCLTTEVISTLDMCSFYHSQLVLKEVDQVLSALIAALQDAREQTTDIKSICTKSMTHLVSTTNQLVHAVSSLH